MQSASASPAVGNHMAAAVGPRSSAPNAAYVPSSNNASGTPTFHSLPPTVTHSSFTRQNLRTELVSILSDTANGCINELGYSEMAQDHGTLREKYNNLKNRYVQDREGQKALQNRVRHLECEVDRLTRENALLRQTQNLYTDEKYRLLDKKYNYVLQLLREHHKLPNSIDKDVLPNDTFGPSSSSKVVEGMPPPVIDLTSPEVPQMNPASSRSTPVEERLPSAPGNQSSVAPEQQLVPPPYGRPSDAVVLPSEPLEPSDPLHSQEHASIDISIQETSRIALLRQTIQRESGSQHSDTEKEVKRVLMEPSKILDQDISKSQSLLQPLSAVADGPPPKTSAQMPEPISCSSALLQLPTLEREKSPSETTDQSAGAEATRATPLFVERSNCPVSVPSCIDSASTPIERTQSTSVTFPDLVDKSNTPPPAPSIRQFDHTISSHHDHDAISVSEAMEAAQITQPLDYTGSNVQVSHEVFHEVSPEVPVEEHNTTEDMDLDTHNMPASAQLLHDADIDMEEEQEESWDDLTDDEADKLPVHECVGAIYFDDNESDERYCQLCDERLKASQGNAPRPEFSESNMRDLISHLKNEHPVAWETLRRAQLNRPVKRMSQT